jgi:hypothetical protein
MVAFRSRAARPRYAPRRSAASPLHLLAVLAVLVGCAASAPGPAIPAVGASRVDGREDSWPRCARAARLTGDPALAAAVEAELARLGVEAGSGCAAVRVRISRAAHALAVDLRDDLGGRARRIVSNAEVAASWIQSWLYPEIAAPLLAVRAGPSPAVRAGPSLAPADLRRAKARSSPSLSATVAADRVQANDGSLWRGLTAVSCARFRWACLGVSGHLADNRDFWPSTSRSKVDRWSAEVLSTVSVPVVLGRLVLEPRVGAGIGYLQTVRSGACACGVAVDDDFAPARFGPRFATGFHALFAVAGPVSITATASLSFAPFAHDHSMMPEYASNFFQRGVVPPSGPLVNNAEYYSLPGEPYRALRLGIGLGLDL